MESGIIGREYPARGFLERFPDVAVQKLVKGFYLDIDFSEASKGIIDTSLLRHIELRGVRDLTGLEIFACAEELHLYDGIFVNNARILHSYMKLKIICITDCIVGHTLFPECMEELEEIHVSRCRYISTIAGTDEGFLCLPERTPRLKKITIIDTVRNGDRRQKLILPKEMDEVREIVLSAGDFMPIALPHDMLPRLKFLDMSGNGFTRSLYLPRTPALKELHIAPSPNRVDALEEIVITCAPYLVRLAVKDCESLRTILLPSNVGKYFKDEIGNCNALERSCFLERNM